MKFKGLEVSARPNEPADRMIARFVKKVRSDGILDLWREKQHYEKPSVRRRTKSSKARWKAAQEKLQE